MGKWKKKIKTALFFLFAVFCNPVRASGGKQFRSTLQPCFHFFYFHFFFGIFLLLVDYMKLYILLFHILVQILYKSLFRMRYWNFASKLLFYFIIILRSKTKSIIKKSQERCPIPISTNCLVLILRQKDNISFVDH